MEWKVYKEEFDKKANVKIEWLNSEFNKIKSGRPNPKILDHVMVEAYGSKSKLYEIANMQVVEGKQIVVKPYDKSLLHEINSGILKENLGLSVQIDADSLRITFPLPSEETRKMSVKKVKEFVEQAKVEIRSIRKDIHQKIKKDKELREDEVKWYEEDLDKLTKSWNNEVDNAFNAKEKELLTI
ncbi:MAG: ribosome recycling factor [Malacoplasma sp.]|nr:ribosome recycling factor [Malacoplasma sp.]